MATKEQVIAALRKAYSMEVETIINYLANSLHLEGVRAESIKQDLATDISGGFSTFAQNVSGQDGSLFCLDFIALTQRNWHGRTADSRGHPYRRFSYLGVAVGEQLTGGGPQIRFGDGPETVPVWNF